MSRCRRLLLLLLGVAGCLVLLMQTVGLDRWPIASTTGLPSHRVNDQDREYSLHVAVSPTITNTVPGLQGGVPEVTVGGLEVPKATLKPKQGELTTKKEFDNQSVIGELVLPSAKLSVPPEFLIKFKEKAKNDLKPPKTYLSPEHLLQIMGSAIGSLRIQNPLRVPHVLITTYFRSGSTFLGDIMQQNWKTFYHFEPLHHLSNGVRLKKDQIEEATSFLSDIMRCNYSSAYAAKYLMWASEQRNTFLMRRNKFLWVACRMQPQLCFRADFVKFICERAPWQVMKVNRLSLEQVGKIVLDNPELDIRVVHLVRDPRGIIASRKVLTWCNTTSCSDFRVLCNEMDQDYQAFQKLKQEKPNSFFELRYEDLSVKPELMSKELFGSLGIPYTNTVGKFLRLNTKAKTLDARDPYSTRRDSSKTPFEWRKKLKLSSIKKMDIGCKSVLKNYGYVPVSSPKQLVGDPRFLYLSDMTQLRT